MNVCVWTLWEWPFFDPWMRPAWDALVQASADCWWVR